MEKSEIAFLTLRPKILIAIFCQTSSSIGRGKTSKLNMNISVTNQHVEFNEIQQLVKFTAGLEVEVLVAISSCCILSDNRYTSSKVRLNKCVGFSLKRNYKRTSMLLSMLSYDR